MAERVRVREIDDDDGQRLLRIVRRGTGSVVTWRRAQMVLLSAQGMLVDNIATVTFTSPDRVRDVMHNFNADGFEALYPKYRGGRPKIFTLLERRESKKIAKSKPAEHSLPFSTWSLVKLADFLVDEGVVDDISHEGLRILLREEGVTFQRVKTWKTSKDPDYEAKKARVEHLYAYTPTNSSWLNRIEAQFTALRYFVLDGTDHPTHKAQGSMIRRSIIWRNKNAADKRLTTLVHRANAA
ncbi:helix-turn-helix domain-containing protein [Streptomyces mirabilis]|uniref:helix-turn-helix domain-containing protein n=1 Tax=Streptomyces mirabilis TaxID=68239 RepID=UPI00331BA7D2